VGPRLRPFVRLRVRLRLVLRLRLRLRLRGVRPRVPRVERLRRGPRGVRRVGERLLTGLRVRRVERVRLRYLLAEDGAVRGDGPPVVLLVTAVCGHLGHDGQGAGLLGALRTVLGACRDGSRDRSRRG
jgi:hypothetical protein